jgi:stalled ribosome rescue protein Dom34
MKRRIGLWIDRQKAVIVFVSQKVEEVKIVKSNLEKYFQPSNGIFSSKDPGRREFSVYDVIEKDMEMHVHKFFDKVISSIRNADSVYIFGPGEIKEGLKKRIEVNLSMTRNVVTESAEKMTNNGILKKVRRHYFPHEPERSALNDNRQPVGVSGEVIE